MLKTIIVDDDAESSAELTALIDQYCPQVEVTHTLHSPLEALKVLQSHAPQLLFLDIVMPRMNGFELLGKLQNIPFEVAFVSAHSEYAMQAYHLNAIGYLLKPVDYKELQKIVQRVAQIYNYNLSSQVNTLEQILKGSAPIHKVALPTMEGLKMIPVENIISCAADDNYTQFYLKHNKKLVAHLSLKQAVEILSKHCFIRVHNSWVVNLNEIDKYVKGEGGYLTMSDGSIIGVSRSHKPQLLQKLLPHNF